MSLLYCVKCVESLVPDGAVGANHKPQWHPECIMIKFSSRTVKFGLCLCTRECVLYILKFVKWVAKEYIWYPSPHIKQPHNISELLSVAKSMNQNISYQWVKISVKHKWYVVNSDYTAIHFCTLILFVYSICVSNYWLGMWLCVDAVYNGETYELYNLT